MMATRVVGQRIPKIDGPEKASGRAVYTADIRLPGMLWGKVLRSPHPYARIVRVDASKARALPGVRAAITGHDIPFTLVGLRLRDLPVLARDVVRFIGEPVAAVAADDLDVAEAALGLIEVEYEVLEPLLDPLAAMQPGAPLLHPDLLSYECLPPGLPEGVPNVHCYVERRRGDVQAGLAQAELVVESTYSSAMMHQAYLEPHACIVHLDSDGRIHVWATNKSPYRVRRQLAEALGLLEERVVVELVRVGGEFGGKGALMDVPIAYYLARASGRPVRMAMTYSEEFLAGHPRHPLVVTFKTGVARDGAIVAHHALAVYDGGAYGGYKPRLNSVLTGSFELGGCYRIPNVLLQSYTVYTNHLPGGFMRAPGDPQAIFGVESHFDMVARRLGMDPLEFRRKNVLQPGDTAPDGEPWRDIRAAEVLAAIEAASRWGQRGPGHVGRGLALADRHLGGEESQTRVTLFGDGRVQLTTGVPDAGQGAHTAMQQIAAEVLTLPRGRVTIKLGNTDEAPFDPGIGATRHTHIAGQSTYRGALELVRRMRACLAEEMGWPEEEIILSNGAFHCPGHEPVPFEAVARLAVSANGSPVEFLSTYRSPAVEHHAFVAQVAEVEVDPETGAFRVRQLVTAHDAGQLINPMAAEGQVEGGAIQGLGFSVMEEMRLEDGRVTTVNLGDYKVPSVADIPELTTVWLDGQGPLPFGGKAIGEHALVPTAAAIGNAIYDAVGVRLTSTPLTAEKVYAALHSSAEC
ncbi:MAG: xanthine dehydrogenase family protein molybdopterin-binding subunit [Chloroflexi bacterium]|nr:xanthine dehydrogenase family protein molybdopterin-binding subunit [Chloroflexota bacterium]